MTGILDEFDHPKPPRKRRLTPKLVKAERINTERWLTFAHRRGWKAELRMWNVRRAKTKRPT